MTNVKKYLKMVKNTNNVSTLDQRKINDKKTITIKQSADNKTCLLYTSDAADDLLCVDLGGRRIL